MKTKSDSSNESPDNQIDKVFSDAKKSLSDLGDIDYLDDIPDDSDYTPMRAAFPYGSDPKRKIDFKRY